MLKKSILIFVFIFSIIVILLFIELYYNKNHSKQSFVLPEDFTIIKGKDVNENDDIIIYNSDEIKRSEAIKKIPKRKRKNYREVQLEEHFARKVSKPFNNIVSDTKESYTENMPVSFVYKTALGFVDLTRDLTTGKTDLLPYKMLISNSSKHSAFIDKGNVYLI